MLLSTGRKRAMTPEDREEIKRHGFRDETRHNFVALRSMIKLSYAELDRRLTTLEDGYGDLKARMERVEARIAS
jgi:hypothetical protein